MLDRTYRFVEVPLVGYVLHEDSFTFGYKEYFSAINYDVHLHVTDKKNVSKLEELIDKELSKGRIKTVAEGIGGVKGDLYMASRMGSLFLALSLEECSLLQTIIPLVFVPGPVYPLLGAYIFKRFGEKKALEQMKVKLKEHVVEYDASGIKKKIDDAQLKQKIKDYAIAKRQGSWWQRLKRIRKLESELEGKRAVIANDIDELIAVSTALRDAAADKVPYETVTHVYSVIRDLYNYTWWQKGMPVIFNW